MSSSKEIEWLIQRLFDARMNRIHVWRNARATYRSRYFTPELISSDQKGWEEYLGFESRNPLLIDRVQIDGHRAEVVVKQPSMLVGETVWLYHLSKTAEGWKISQRQQRF